MERCSPTTFFSSALRMTGTIKPFSSATAIPILISLMVDDVRAFDGSIQDGKLREWLPPSLQITNGRYVSENP